MIKKSLKQGGYLSLTILIFGTIAIIILSGLIIWVDADLKSIIRRTDQSLAFRIAEAGVEYYRWHLVQAPNDFRDGTGQLGPYIHNFYDRNGILLGTFSLNITSPLPGSSVVTINSTGKVNNTDIEKSIEVKMAKPSFVKFAIISNSDIGFDEGTEISGQVHSNGGIRFNGLAHNLVTSAVAQYKDPDHSGNDEFGVHTHVNPVDPSPPNPVPNRTDVFEAGRQFPVPAINFAAISATLADIKNEAIAGGIYYGPSDEEGYQLIFRTDDTVDIYKVISTINPPNGCNSIQGEQDWDTWTIDEKDFLGNFQIPASGLIFFEDHVWIQGKISSARAIVAAGVFPENPSKHAHITVNNDLKYSNYDGADTIGLIAQGNINIGLISENDLRIDAALIAQNGRVGRYYYRPPSGGSHRCAPDHVKSLITIYGMIATNQRYEFSFDDGSGYQARNIIYDPNLLYSYPSNFPVTSDFYEQIFWNEVR